MIDKEIINRIEKNSKVLERLDSFTIYQIILIIFSDYKKRYILENNKDIVLKKITTN